MTRMERAIRLTASLVLLLTVASSSGAAVRVKDIAKLDGVRRNQLLGYGLVVGLQGTGDKSQTEFTTQTTANLLEQLGVAVSSQAIKVKNVAAVIVTADLLPFSRAGQRIDVTVSSLGDAKSLQGGVLLLTPLRAPNGDVYAVAQGPVVLGGFSVQSQGSGTQTTQPTVGRIPSGGLLERDAPLPDLGEGFVDLLLERPDFTTASRLAQVVASAFGDGSAQAMDAGRVRIVLPAERASDPVPFLAELERLKVETDVLARVVIDERTGTVVLGEDVTLRPVAVSQGNLTVSVTPYLEVSQPEPNFGIGGGGRTVARDRSEVTATEGEGKLFLLDRGQNLASLVQALNALGVTSQDLVAIFQALKASGALEAELEIL